MQASRRCYFVDFDAFFCACAILCDRTLRDVPFAVGGSPEQRGVVASASYPARLFGVRSAMPMARALRLCPTLRIVAPRFDDYRQRSEAVMIYLRNLSPHIEQRSIDEAVLELGEDAGEDATVAQQIQHHLRTQFRLPCSLGVASGPLLAKVAVEMAKSQGLPGKMPQAVQVIPAGGEAAFLAPLPTRIMPGIGPKLAVTLQLLGIHTLGDLAQWPLYELVQRIGPYGLPLQRRAQGIDSTPLDQPHQRKALSQEHTFAYDIADAAILTMAVQQQAGHISQQLQRKGQHARVVKLKLRYADFATVTRQVTLSAPTHQEEVLHQAALRLFTATWDTTRQVRLIGVGVHGLHALQQLPLWDASYR